MSTTMLAGRLEFSTLKFAMETVPIPEPGAGEIRIQVKAAGICLTDIHMIEGSLKFPNRLQPRVTLGHETSGIVDKVGERVTVWKAGDRVVLSAGERCGHCTPCQEGGHPCQQRRGRGIDFDGGWAEYAIARQDAALSIPADLPFEQAAILPDAVTTPYAAVVDSAKLRPAESIGLWGVGGLGAHAVQISRALGAAPILAIDPLPAARERAIAFGADAALDPMQKDFREQVLHWTGGKGLDIAMDLAGVAPARTQALSVLARHGRLVLVGLADGPMTVPNDTEFCCKKIELRGAFGSTQAHLKDVLKLASYRRLDFSRSVSNYVPLAEAPYAVEKLIKKEGNPIRIVLKP